MGDAVASIPQPDSLSFEHIVALAAQQTGESGLADPELLARLQAFIEVSCMPITADDSATPELRRNRIGAILVS